MANFLKSLFIKGVEIDTASATTGNSLIYNGTKFAPATPGTGSISLDGLSDVVITTPLEFQTLEYNGTNWVNANTPSSVYVRNAEATTITTGTCVYLFGATGDHATVKRADHNSDATSAKTVGVVSANILTSENGVVVTQGYVDGIDLSTGYTAGDVLWLGEAGAFTTTKPTAPDHLVFIGVVVRATNNGIIYVATQNGYELDELHNVSLPSPASGDFLKYNGSLWVADAIDLGTDTTGNYVGTITAGTGVTTSGASTGEGIAHSISIGQSVATSATPTFAGLRVDGNTAIGTAPLAGYSFWVTKPITGLPTSYGIVSSGTVQSDVTSGVNQFITGGNTAVAAFTLGSYNHFNANGVATPGAGSTITTQNSFLVTSTTTGATNNFGFRGLIPTGANNNWNLYMDGTAPNHMLGRLAIGTTTGAAMLRVQNDTAGNATVILRNAAAQSGSSFVIQDSAGAQFFGIGTTGNVGIGTVLSASTILRINKPITGGVSSVGYYITSAIDSDYPSITAGTGYYSFIGATSANVASPPNIANINHHYVGQGTFTNTTVTNQYGYYADSSLTGATNNYGYFGNIGAATGRWNLYMGGSANNYMAGNLGIGTATPSTALQVVGTVTATAFAGPLTGNVTGNVSGTAATVTGAAQSAITSVGTLTGLTVSNATTAATFSGSTTNSANPVVALNGVAGSGALNLFNDMGAGSYNGIVTAGSKGIIASGANNTTSRGSLVIAPWSDVNYGIRFTGGSTTDILVRGTTTFTPSIAANKALIVQGVATQAGDFFDVQESGGASRFKVDSSGNLFVASNITTGDAKTKVGFGRTGNGYSYIDLIGDATYTDYGLRLLRGNTGANAASELLHRGTGNFQFTLIEAASILFSTSNTERMRIDATGNLLLGTTSRRSVGGGFQTGSVHSIFNEQAGIATALTPFTAVINRADSNGLRFVLGKSRGTAAGAVTALVSGDSIAEFHFAGADGSTLDPLAARIMTHVDGAVATGSVPGRLSFATNPVAGTNPVERMRIDSSGNVGIGTSSPTEKLDVAGNIALTGSVVFEGATADGFETTLAVTDPTGSDKTITLPNASGTVALVGTQTVRSITASTDTPTGADLGDLLTIDTTSGAVTVTINSSLGLTAGQRIDFVWIGAATSVTFSASSVTLNGTPGLKLRARYSAATLVCTASDTYVLVGDLSA